MSFLIKYVPQIPITVKMRSGWTDKTKVYIDAGKMLESIGLDRTKVYISNVVNYRPPQNRKPSDEEIKRYYPFLRSHIEIINPKILLLLGSTALKTIVGNVDVISKARGKWLKKKIGTCSPDTIASFHPAFLMRQPDQKKLAWIDLKLVREKAKQLKL